MEHTSESQAPVSVAGDSAFRAALEVRAVTSRLRRRVMAVADDESLTGGQAAVLMRIASGDVTTASALAIAERVSPQAIAATLGALQQRGYVLRTPDPTDGRRHLVEVTDAGRARVERTRDAGREWLETALAEQYTEAERQTIIAAMALLERVLA